MKNINSQLNNLKSVKPSNNWKSKNRDFLLAQVYNSAEAKPAEFTFSFFLYAKEISHDLLNVVSQPAMVVGLVFVFLFGGGLAGTMASKDTKPGDSLYVAKMISEKTQMALTFDEKEKVQLRIDFAGNRAEEIDQVLAVVGEDNNEQTKIETKQKVDDLVVNMKKEIGAAKTGLQRIRRTAKIDTKTKEEAPKKDESGDNVAITIEKEEDEIFSANIGKQVTGISTSEKADTDVKKAERRDDDRKEKGKDRDDEDKEEDSRALLNRAKESLRGDDVDKTLSALEKVDEVINKRIDGGEVKGVSEENASSTVDKD